MTPLHVAGLRYARARVTFPFVRRAFSFSSVRETFFSPAIRGAVAPPPGWLPVGAAVARAGPAPAAGAGRARGVSRRAHGAGARSRPRYMHAHHGHHGRICGRLLAPSRFRLFPRCALAIWHRRRHNGKRESGWFRPCSRSMRTSLYIVSGCCKKGEL